MGKAMGKIVIVGAGFTGEKLARALVDEGVEVVLIDKDAAKVNFARNRLDCTVIQSCGNSLKTLENDAGIATASALIALTEDDEVNMVTCSLVDAEYPDVMKIARVRNDAYYVESREAGGDGAGTRPLFGIDHMLHPDVAAAAAIWRALSQGAVGNVVPLAGGFGIVSLPITESCPIAGMSLRDLASIPEWKYLVAYVESSGKACLPNGDTTIAPEDRIGVVSPVAEMDETMRFILGGENTPARRLVVFGAGRVGSLLVERQLSAKSSSILNSVFRRERSDVTLVDSDENLCRAAKERFRGIRVLCGDVTDADLISEAAIDKCDVLVAASANYDRNLVVASYLKSHGVKRTIALTESEEFDDVARKLGIDVPVPMRGTVVDSILSHLRGRHVTSVHTVSDGRFEIVGCDVAPESQACGKEIRELSRPGEYLVLLVRHAADGTFSLPHGDTVLGAGDHVDLIARAGDRKISRLFAAAEGKEAG